MSGAWTPECGERVREKRTALGLTQAELGRRMGVNQGVDVCNAEKARGRMTLDRLVRLADALDASVDWLLGRTPPREDLQSTPDGLSDSALRALRTSIDAIEAIRRADRELARDDAGPWKSVEVSGRRRKRPGSAHHK